MQEVESAGGASGSDVSTNGGWWFWKGTLRFGGASEGTRVRRKPLPGRGRCDGQKGNRAFNLSPTDVTNV